MRKMCILVLLACFVGTAFGLTGTNKIIRPNGGNGWAAGLTKQIRWQHSKKDTSIIELHKGDGADPVVYSKYLTIADSVQRSVTTSTTYSRYNWTIPTNLPAGNDYKVVIRNYNAPTSATALDFSDNAFSIIKSPYITVTTPNGGEELVVGNTKIIEWGTNLTESISSGSPLVVTTDSVRIVLLKGGVENAALDTVVGRTLNGGTLSGSFPWVIPTTLAAANDYKIKIIDHDGDEDGTVYDESDDYFYIGASTAPYTLTAPSASGIVWLKGLATSTKYITWDNINSTEEVTLQYVKGVAAAVPITGATTLSGTLGSFAWDIKDLVAGNDYKVKIVGNTSAASDLSDYTFSVYDSLYLNRTTLLSTQKVADPAGAETTDPLYYQPVKDSTGFTITWNATIPDGNIIIKLYRGGEFIQNIATLAQGGVADVETYSWVVPSSLPVGGGYSIEIISDKYPTLFRDMSQTFAIRNKAIKITYPTAGELLMADIPTTVRFNTTALGGATIKIELLNALMTDVSGVYDLTLASTAGTFTNSDPYGSQTFTWTPTILADATPTNPIVAGSGYTIRVTSNDNAKATAVTGSFSIAADRTITAAGISGAPYYLGKTTATIKWTENFSNEPVVIALFKNGVQVGAPVATVTSTALPTIEREKTWVVPSDLAEAYTYRFKIWNKNHPTIIDSTDNFAILEAPIRVVSPNASGLVWYQGSTHDITWVSGITENVVIDAFLNTTSGTKTTIATEALNNNNGLNITASGDTILNSYKGKYSWTIPSDLAEGSYIIQVSGFTNIGTNDISNATFEIKAPPAVTVTDFAGADLVFKIGEEKEIKWTTTNFTGKVKIDLMKETTTAPKKYLHHSWITQSTKTSPYSWKVPSSIASSGATGNYKIRIQSIGADSSSVRDTNATALRIIINPIVIVKPNSIGKYGLWTLDSTVTATFNIKSDASLTAPLAFFLEKASDASSTNITANLAGTPTAIADMIKITAGDKRTAIFKLPTTLLPGTDYKLKITCAGTATDVSDSSFTVQYAYKRTDLADQLIKEFKLEQNYPNPFNNTTDITYYVPTGYNDNVKVSVYNIKGEVVSNLVNKNHTTGKHVVSFNATSVVSGVYYYAIEGTNFKAIKRMVLLK